MHTTVLAVSWKGSKSLDLMVGKREIQGERNPRLLHSEVMGEGSFLSIKTEPVVVSAGANDTSGSISTHPEMETNSRPMPAGVH